MCVCVRVSTSRRFVEEETANDDEELILYIRRVSRTAERVVFSIHTRHSVYIFFPAVFQCRSVFFSSFKHRYIIRLDAHRRTTIGDMWHYIYIYKYIEAARSAVEEGRREFGWYAIWRGLRLAALYLWFERGNNSVSKKTVLPVSEWQGGAERVFSIYTYALFLYCCCKDGGSTKPYLVVRR